MSEVFFTSDLHLNHVKILEYTDRGNFWDTPEEMSAALIRNWNEVVSPEDIVYVLGDFAMGNISESLPMALQLNGTKLLILGNHDRCHPAYGGRKQEEWRARYEEVGFTILPEQVRLPVNSEYGGGEIMLCHFPYIGDSHDEDRYNEYRPVDDGSILFHGHIHGKWKQNGRMYDVGVDARNYRPVTINEILGSNDEA